MAKTCEGRRLDGRICGAPLNRNNRSGLCTTHTLVRNQDLARKSVGVRCDATAIKTGKRCGLLATRVLVDPSGTYRTLYRCHAHAPATARPITEQDKPETSP